MTLLESALTAPTDAAPYRPRLRAYRALSATALRAALAYKFQLFMGLLANIFLLLTMLYLWRTILADRAQVGFTWPQMKAYLMIAFVANSVVSWYTDWRMAGRIRDGMVAIDLTKPVHYQRARFAEAVGFAAFEYATGILIVLVALVFFGGVPVPHGVHAVLFLISMVLVMPLKFCIVYSTALLCFWAQNYMGINWARTAIVNLMSGAVIPLQFFPGWLRALAEWLPFRGLAFTPAMLYLERYTVRESLVALLVQAVWVVLLWFGASFAWRAASRRLTVHGG